MSLLALWEVLKRVPWEGLTLVAIGTVLFFGGIHVEHLKSQVQTAKLTDDLGKARAVLQQQQDQLTWEHNYELQLRAAADQANARRAVLARLRSAVAPSVVCHITPAADRDPLSGAAGHPAAHTPGSGLLSPAAGEDIGNDLFLAADYADEVVELTREYIAKQPPP